MKNPLKIPKPNQLTTKLVDTSFGTWVNQDFITESTREKIQLANVLIVPNIGHINSNDWCFPQGTNELFHFLQNHKRDELIVEACIEDDDYKELILHTDLLFIAEILVSYAIAPLVINLISSYIYDLLGTRLQRSTVKAKLTVVQEEARNTVEFTYDGPAQEYESVMINAIGKLTSNSTEIVPTSNTHPNKPPKLKKKR